MKRASTAWTETSYVPATSGVKLNVAPLAVANATAVLPDGPASVQTNRTGPEEANPQVTPGSVACATSVTGLPTLGLPVVCAGVPAGSSESVNVVVNEGLANVTAAAPQAPTTMSLTATSEWRPRESVTVSVAR